MKKRKTLQELTLKDNFLFAAVMMEQENCQTAMCCLSAILIRLC